MDYKWAIKLREKQSIHKHVLPVDILFGVKTTWNAFSFIVEISFLLGLFQPPYWDLLSDTDETVYVLPSVEF